MLTGMLVASVTPLRAVQILWMNLVTDGFPFMRLLGTTYVDATGWGLILACSILPVILIDRVKLVLRRKEG
jgi:hypothetical protein